MGPRQEIGEFKPESPKMNQIPNSMDQSQNSNQKANVRGIFMREHISHHEMQKQAEQKRLMKEYLEYGRFLNLMG
jgi:hypothetical protein